MSDGVASAAVAGPLNVNVLATHAAATAAARSRRDEIVLIGVSSVRSYCGGLQGPPGKILDDNHALVTRSRKFLQPDVQVAKNHEDIRFRTLGRSSFACAA